MSAILDKAAWGLFGGTTRGASHVRHGLPNQDAIGMWTHESASLAIMVVSDGHGSASHFRSDSGSRMAVDATLAVLRAAPLPVPQGSEQELSRKIVGAWREGFQAHLAAHPFTESEWAKLPANEAEQSKRAILANPAIAYGATLLAVLAAADEVLFLQLGDGDILCVDDGGAARRPVQEDSRLVANQTTSLCQEDAAENFRFAHLRAGEAPLPRLILVSTDGYSNSFQSDEDFLQVGPDYLDLIRRHGGKMVEAQLAKILPEASRKGSGDDITLGMIERISSAAQAAPDPATAAPPEATLPVETAPPEPAAPDTTRKHVQSKLLWTRAALVLSAILLLTGLALAWWQPSWLAHVRMRSR